MNFREIAQIANVVVTCKHEAGDITVEIHRHADYFISKEPVFIHRVSNGIYMHWYIADVDSIAFKFTTHEETRFETLGGFFGSTRMNSYVRVTFLSNNLNK